MARWNQTWVCRACGHRHERTVTYPKYGASETPICQLALRAMCSKCGAMGRCRITEALAGQADGR